MNRIQRHELAEKVRAGCCKQFPFAAEGSALRDFYLGRAAVAADLLIAALREIKGCR